MSVLVSPVPPAANGAGAVPVGGEDVFGPEALAALRRAHRRGLAALVLGALIGVAAFGTATAWVGVTPSAQWEGGALAGPAALRSAAGSARASESLVLRSDNRGQVLFGRYCDSCHPGGNESVGASLRSTQFKSQFSTPDKVTAFVRRGGFDMPAYTPDFLSNEDLADIAAYVVSLPAGR